MTPLPEFRDDRWAELANGVDMAAPLPRLCYAAVHVAMLDSYREVGHMPDSPGAAHEIAEHIDWESTMSLRTSIARTGMGIAEAMDTAQRFSLGWDAARDLIERTGKLGIRFCAGASTDHLERVETTTQLVDGVCSQIETIRSAGGVPVILPMPLLPSLGTDASGYVEVYGDIVRNSSDGPLIVHWLGPMFMPSLEGYFPGDSFEKVMQLDPQKLRAAKISMLDGALEVRLRRELLKNDQVMLTGDDFHFAGLIAGDGSVERTTTLGDRDVPLGDFSHALLGIFDAIAEPAALALRLLDRGDRTGYDEIMSRCEALGQCVFEEPTRFYKTGLAFLSWLNGHQPNAMLVNHEETCRDREHLLRVARLADEAGAITDPKTASKRVEGWISESE
ncbi:MAG: DUF993 family protein [Armatimonadetes bacterium]|nr:DUF993 family protein [Armatimonadota bacterium]